MLNGGLFYFSLSLILIGAQPVNQTELPVVLVGNLFFSSSFLLRGTRSLRSERDVENLIGRILDKYADAGFPFSRVRPKYAGLPDSLPTLRLAVEEGPRVRIADYIFRIRGKTNPQTLKKWTRVRTDEYFSRRELERVKRRIARSGLYKEIRDQILRRGDEYYLRLDLGEEPSDFITAGGSLTQTDGDFFGMLDSRNLLGEIRELHAQYEYRKLFRLQYADPILIAPLELSLDFAIATYDSARLVNINGRLSAPVTESFRISILSGREMVSYSDPDRTGYQSSLVGLGLEFRPESDFIRTAQVCNIEYLFRTAARIKFQYDGQFDFLHLMIKPHFWWTRTDQFEYFDYFRIGGSRTIRGYLEEEIIAREIFWVNNEYKKYLFYPLFDFAFADGRFYYAYGLGLDVRTSLGNAALALVWPRDGDWRDGKLHFFIEKGF
jgi:hypothetical protein